MREFVRALDAFERELPSGELESWTRWPEPEALGYVGSLVMRMFAGDQLPTELVKASSVHPKTMRIFLAALRADGSLPPGTTRADVDIVACCYATDTISWARAGYPTVRTPPELGAAYMLTEPSYSGPLRWPSVYLPLPPDTLTTRNMKVAALFASILEKRDREHRIEGWHDDDETIRVLALEETTNLPMPAMMVRPDFSDKQPVLFTPDAAELAYRYLASVCLAFGEGHYSPGMPSATRRRWRPKGAPPETDDFVLAPPVRVRRDLRPVVRAICSGESPFGKYQWGVSGHWRNQRWGPGLSLVKRKWIAPYMKGPVDAPILKRDYYVGGRRSEGEKS